MDQDIQKKLEELEQKVDAVFKSVEKTRKYFLIVMWVTVLAFVLPLVGLVFALPAFFNNYLGAFSGLL